DQAAIFGLLDLYTIEDSGSRFADRFRDIRRRSRSVSQSLEWESDPPVRRLCAATRRERGADEPDAGGANRGLAEDSGRGGQDQAEIWGRRNRVAGGGDEFRFPGKGA